PGMRWMMKTSRSVGMAHLPAGGAGSSRTRPPSARGRLGPGARPGSPGALRLPGHLVLHLGDEVGDPLPPFAQRPLARLEPGKAAPQGLLGGRAGDPRQAGEPHADDDAEPDAFHRPSPPRYPARAGAEHVNPLQDRDSWTTKAQRHREDRNQDILP